MTTRLEWGTGKWTNPPGSAEVDGNDLIVEASEGSDAWVKTSYGFVHESEHALLRALPSESAVEVTFVCDFDQQFDQAGVFLRVDEVNWIKGGVEISDGQLHVGAVVTNGYSDWSMAPVPEWKGQPVTLRLSRSRDAITIRAGLAKGEKRLIRVAHLDPEATADAGPYCCAPTRAGLRVRFTGWFEDPADEALHPS